MYQVYKRPRVATLTIPDALSNSCWFRIALIWQHTHIFQFANVIKSTTTTEAVVHNHHEGISREYARRIRNSGNQS